MAEIDNKIWVSAELVCVSFGSERRNVEALSQRTERQYWNEVHDVVYAETREKISYLDAIVVLCLLKLHQRWEIPRGKKVLKCVASK